MNFNNLFEWTRKHHSIVGKKEVRLLLNRASDDFCRRSEVFRPAYNQMSTAGQRFYSIVPVGDINIIKVLKVQIDDVTIPRLLTLPTIEDDEYSANDELGETSGSNLGAPSTTSNERYWYIDGTRIGIVEKVSNAITRDDKTSDLQSISVDDKEIRIFSISLARHLEKTDNYASETEKMFRDIPAQFHDALLYKVIAYLYMDPPALAPDMAAAFDTRYMELVNEAKKYIKSNKVRGGYIKPVSF